MKQQKYELIAKEHEAENPKLKNAVIAFLIGGLIGMLGEGLIELLCNIFHMSRNNAGTIMIVIMIFIASLSTALGFFDKLVTKFKCGLLIPITGFAHSMTSAALDYKREGPIYGIGSNIFKLAGSVILYGIVAAWFFGMIRYLLGGRI
ncbi:MAG: SpoVA/SpoVAEb family sporulation membrane protein [Candidatus Faecimonas sp.]|nr:SpoVA/SpoVAEb family sporulation membrane protein [Mycoplasmatota bacterium]MDY2908598.1 SpoVA/SpoVAEb family sporulation membrane protein [Candidatus Faecimonas sp.]